MNWRKKKKFTKIAWDLYLPGELYVVLYLAGGLD